MFVDKLGLKPHRFILSFIHLATSDDIYYKHIDWFVLSIFCLNEFAALVPLAKFVAKSNGRQFVSYAVGLL